jgi:hypothetical protein
MAKYRPAGSKKGKAAASNRGLIPCAIVIIGGIALILILFYLVLQSN